MEILLILLGVIAAFVGVIFYSSLSWGYVCMKFWGWFIVPLFPQLPQIGFWQAVGLMFFINLFHNHGQAGIKKEYKEDSWQTLVGALLSPWIVLFCAIIIRMAA